MVLIAKPIEKTWVEVKHHRLMDYYFRSTCRIAKEKLRSEWLNQNFFYIYVIYFVLLTQTAVFARPHRPTPRIARQKRRAFNTLSLTKEKAGTLGRPRRIDATAGAIAYSGTTRTAPLAALVVMAA
ncbi:hypothetical protein [Rhodoblastus acidophilus]|uniref:hypothetical protein n=1 Tax=Rhodoblastus acidophilus TaxID=1074 RepID=UPI00113131F0|nr:hypothetical protein [Rhodoblastus acidophilus]